MSIMSAHGWHSVALFSSLLMLQQEICASENTLKKNMPSSSQDKRTQTRTGVSAAAGILFLYMVAAVCTRKRCGWQVMGEDFYNQHTLYKRYSDHGF